MNTVFKSVLLSACATALTALSSLASAQTAAPTAPVASPTAPAASAARHGKGHHGGKMMAKVDTNKDGQISRDEAKGHRHLERRFDAIDTNKDAQLSRPELKAYRAAHKGQAKGQSKVEGQR